MTNQLQATSMMSLEKHMEDQNKQAESESASSIVDTPVDV